jgi:hypothetical protein
MWPIATGATDGRKMPIRTTPTTKVAAGDATALLQNTAHAAAISFELSPHPSQSPDIDMLLAAAAVVGLSIDCGFATPWVTAPTAKARASNMTDIRRILAHHMTAEIASGCGQHQGAEKDNRSHSNATAF